jgi:AcrR family transcriptional regulator
VTVPPPKPTSDPARRQLVLRTAARLLRHYGPAKTTIADIAREAGIGVGSVYLEFCSKDDIVEALSRDGHARVIAAMRDALGRDGSHADRLCAMLDARFAAFFELSDEGAHAAELLHCERSAVQRIHKHFLEEQQALVAGFLESARAAGEFAADDPGATAAALLTAYETLSPPYVYARCRESAAARHRSLHQLVLRGLLRRG